LAVFRGRQVTRATTTTGLYETPAMKQLYAALGASFASHLVASGHSVFAGVTKCSIEVMKYGAADPAKP
jgi:biotin carboxyl carrier protein